MAVGGSRGERAPPWWRRRRRRIDHAFVKANRSIHANRCGSRLTLAEQKPRKDPSARFLLLAAALLDQAQLQCGIGMVLVELQRLPEGIDCRIRVLRPPEDAGYVIRASGRSRRPQ